MSESPSSFGSGLTEETDKTSIRPSPKKSRLSFGSPSFFRSSPETSPGAKSPKSEFFSSRKISGSPDPSDSGLFNGVGNSEVSIGSSASQTRSVRSTIIKNLKRMSISSTLLSFRDSGLQVPIDPMAERLALKGKDLEVILEGAFGISEQIQIIFDKHKETIASDERALDLKAMNDKIVALSSQFFTKVALYGDNGTGKSSLINALLDREQITPISDGNSGTATPIEFRMKDRSKKMTSDYTVIADIITDEEWIPLAKGLLKDLEGDPADVKSIIARDILGHMFDLTEGDMPIGLERIRNIPFDCKNRAKRLDFSSQDYLELLEHIKKLNTCYWPVLKKITVYMESPVLNTGVILVDIPGSRDMNPIKMAAASHYLESCEHIFIVSDDPFRIAGTDDSLLDPVLRQIGTSTNFTIILTQIDKITPTTNTQDWNRKQAILDRVENARAGLTRKSPESRLYNANFFAVSSMEYQLNHKRAIDPKTTPCLSFEESNIPSVRRYIQERGLQRWESVIKCLRTQGNIATLMNSVHSWCITDQDSSSPVIQETVSLGNQAIRFNELETRINDIVDTKVSVPLNDAFESFRRNTGGKKMINSAVKKAKESANDWMISTCGSSFSKFDRIRRNRGSHGMHGEMELSGWNKALADPLINMLEGPWISAFDPPDKVLVDFRNFGELLFKEISESTSNATSNTKNCGGLRFIKSNIDFLAREQQDKWEEGLGQTKLRFMESQKTIKAGLEPMYPRLLAVGGEGALGKGRKIVNEQAEAFIPGHYQKIRDTVFEELDSLIVSLEADLTNGLNVILEDIRSTYFDEPEKEVKVVDFTGVRAELLTLCNCTSRIVQEFEYRINQPRTTETLMTMTSKN